MSQISESEGESKLEDLEEEKVEKEEEEEEVIVEVSQEDFMKVSVLLSH